MKVKKLIELLSQMDPELMVVVAGYEGGVDEMDKYELCDVELNVNTEWYYGKHGKGRGTQKERFNYCQGNSFDW